VNTGASQRWEHEALLEATERRLEKMPDAARIRLQTAEHVFGILKSWMGAAHFLMQRLPFLCESAALV
jgi:transposase